MSRSQLLTASGSSNRKKFVSVHATAPTGLSPALAISVFHFRERIGEAQTIWERAASEVASNPVAQKSHPHKRVRSAHGDGGNVEGKRMDGLSCEGWAFEKEL